jgi:hypothetical protein
LLSNVQCFPDLVCFTVAALIVGLDILCCREVLPAEPVRMWLETAEVAVFRMSELVEDDVDDCLLRKA